MKHWRAHQSHQGFKDLFAFQVRGGNDGLQRGVAFGPPLRAEAVGHFAMNHAGAQGAFAHVVGGRDAGIMQKGQEFVAVFGEARLQPQRPLPRDLLLHQIIQWCVQLRGLRDEGRLRVGAIKLMRQVNGGLEQVLRGLRPGVRRFRVQHALQVAQLMRQTQLKDVCRGFELGAETITDPDFDGGLAHDFGNHRRPATGGEIMIDAGLTAKDPLPPGLAVDARTGFITMNDRTRFEVFFAGGSDARSGGSGPCQERAHAALAEVYARQVVQGGDHALIAQMLGLFEIHDRSFQPWPELPVGLQARRQHAAIARLTMGTDDFVLLRLNDHGRDTWHLGQLPPPDLRGREALQVGLTVVTLRDGRDQHLVGVLHQRARVPFVSKGGAEFLLVGSVAPVLFLVARGGLRRIARGRGRLGQARDFGL